MPTSLPTSAPTYAPTGVPTYVPTYSPSNMPSNTPTFTPTSPMCHAPTPDVDRAIHNPECDGTSTPKQPGYVCNVTCESGYTVFDESGYTLSGDIVCQTDGTWSVQFVCDIACEGALNTTNMDSSLTHPHGLINATDPTISDPKCGSMVRSTHVCNFVCPVGWCRIGTTLTCNSVGIWTGHNMSFCSECPDPIMFEGSFEEPQFQYAEGVQGFGTANSGSSDRRLMAALSPSRVAAVFEGPPNSILAIRWVAFDLSACGIPLCDFSGNILPCPYFGAGEEEWVTIKDGNDQVHSNVIRAGLCGATTPEPIIFSGNTGRIEAQLILSSFQFEIQYLFNNLTFHLPIDPTYAFGSTIAIDWSLALRLVSSVHGSVGKHGWVGLYKDHACEDGAEAHKCYEASDSVNTIGLSYSGTVTFSYPRDYTSAGHYSLRYFSGDASGVVCKIPAALQDWAASDDDSAMESANSHYNSGSWVIPRRCSLEPLSTARILISHDMHQVLSQQQLAQKIPGFERSINY